MHANQRSNQLSHVFGLALGLHAVTAGGTRTESLAEAQPCSLASTAQLYISVCRLRPMRQMLLWGAGWGHVPRKDETQLGMLTEAPCGRSQPSPSPSHPMPRVRDHPGVACWGSWGWGSGRTARPVALLCLQTGAELPAGPRALRSALLTLQRSPASIHQEEQKPRVVAGGNVV